MTGVLALVLGAGPGCRPDRDPIGPDASKSTLADVPVRGHEVRVDLAEGSSLRGELIAVGPEGLWVWTGAVAIEGATGAPRTVGQRWRKAQAEHRFVPTDQIRRVVVSRYRAGPAMAATGAWTGGLMLVTFSHGFFLIITMPLVAVAGGGAVLGTHLQSKAYVHRRGLGSRGVPLPERLSRLRGFARFPQGVPPGWPTVGDGEAEAVAAEAVAAEAVEPEAVVPEVPGTEEPAPAETDDDGR
ncbi:MAG: hypothetical protein AB1Z98_15030 [Nannocystaceae bacterium]